jgi:hypothetical protein
MFIVKTGLKKNEKIEMIQFTTTNWTCKNKANSVNDEKLKPLIRRKGRGLLFILQ